MARLRQSLARAITKTATIFFLAVLIGTLPPAAVAQSDNVKMYAQMPIMMDPQLSPDGTRIAFLSSLKGRVHLVVEQFSPEFKRNIIEPNEAADFMWVKWANDDRIVFAVTFTGRRYTADTEETRLFSANGLGFGMTPIIKPDTIKQTGSRVAKSQVLPLSQDNVLHWLPEDPDHILVSVNRPSDGMELVRKVNVEDGKFDIITREYPDIAWWVADQQGLPRFAGGYQTGSQDLAMRFMKSDGEWIQKNNAEWWGDDFQPVAFTDDPAIAYAIGRNDRGLDIVRELNLETGEFGETLFEHERFDADGVVIEHTTNLPVGVAYTDDTYKVEYFDPTLKKLKATIDKALPDTANVIQSTSVNRRQILIHAYSESNPGSYFLWDRDGKSLSLYESRLPKLPEDAVRAPQSVAYEARDGQVIPAYLTLPAGSDGMNLPTVVMPHGGPQARDDASYWFLTQFLAASGYAVLQPNFRGSSGYGAAYQNAGVAQWGGLMQDDVTDGTSWLVSEGIADPDRICIVGWSYGGYAAAMGAVKEPDLYQCAASINGVLNLPRLHTDVQDFVGGSDWTRHMKLDGKSSRTVSPVHQAEHIQVPMLIVQALDDARVPKTQGESMRKELQSRKKDVTYVTIDFGGHSMRNEAGRTIILEELETFLRDNIGT